MQELFDEILEVIKKYHMDAVYHMNGAYHTLESIEQLHDRYLREHLSDNLGHKPIALYGGGKYCESIFNVISDDHRKITCIIDNYESKKVNVKNGMPIVSINDFLLNYEEQTEAVIIVSWNYHEAFREELELVGYRGKIIDIPEYMLKKLPDFTRPIYEYAQPFNYLQINELEVKYHQKTGIEQYIVLKQIVYELCLIKDFLYAEKYIHDMEEKFKEYGESSNYRSAINEIKEIMKCCAKQQGGNVLFIHIVDSLADYIVDQMPWLNEWAKKGIRFRGVTAQYPCTQYSMNTMFTGKTPFEIEETTIDVKWEDSELLSFIKSRYSINFVSVDSLVSQQFEEINDNHVANWSHYALTEALFEGLALWKKKNHDNVIIFHSGRVLHASFFRIGTGKKLFLCEEMIHKSQFEEQFKNAIQYTDEELAWYDNYYSLTEMPMIIMGDHGVSSEEVYNYFLGVKQDITRGNIKELTEALVINRVGKQAEISGLVPNTKIPNIFKAVLENKTDTLESMCEDVVELEFIPGWDEKYCKRFMSRSIYGQYEGFIGIRTLDEIYLISASDRELYFRFEVAGGYRNCVYNNQYKANVEKCRKMFVDKKFPISIFKAERYKKHLELLEIYDNECYQEINRKMNAL